MNRREYLEAQLNEELGLLQEYEEQARNETEPRRRRSHRANIARQKETIQELEQELAQLPANLQSPTANLRFYANAPYGLEAGFTGRSTELTLLDNWLTNDPGHPLLALIALGGTGKSALAWYWQQRLVGAVREPLLQAIIWWDFYQPTAGVAEFLNDALTFFGDEPQRYGNSRLQVNRLFEHLRRRPALLVLDGAERLLRVYSRMDAAYLDDAEAEAGQLHGRDCVDPVAANLLTGLAQMQGQSKTLLTSRLLPRELEGRGGGLLQGMYRHNLTGLDLEDAYQLFKEQDIKATRAEVRAVAEPLGYHPLSLVVLAGYAADDPKAPNDLRAAAGYDTMDILMGERQHILHRAYDSLPPQARQLLSRLAAFRGGVTWETIEAVMGGGKSVRDDLNLLQRRGLLQRTVRDGAASYDLHPIVRRYAYDRLADPAATHEQLANYFGAIPPPERVHSLTDLTPTIELFHHLVHAGQHDNAFFLYRHRISHLLYYQLGAYQQITELLELLLSGDRSSNKLLLSSEWAQSWALNSLGNSHGMLGQPKAAIESFEAAIAIDEKTGDKDSLAVALVNLASMALIPTGALTSANAVLKRSIDLCQEQEKLADEASARTEYGLLLIYLGDWIQAEAELSTALYQLEGRDTWYSGIAWGYIALAALLQNKVDEGLTAAREALRLAEETSITSFRHEADYVWSYWLLGWASLKVREFQQAQNHLDKALFLCRATSNVNSEPAILLAQARLARVVERNGISFNYAQEALQIAERAGYRLDLADVHNFLAQLALDEGNQSLARRHAQKARDYAWCDGPPYAYQSALDEANRLLELLGEED